MTVKKKLPSKRLSVSLPGELHARLELYLRDFAGGAGANDVIGEALRVCFDADKEFRRAWDEETAGASSRYGAEAPRAAGPSRTAGRHTTPHDQSEKGSMT